MTLTDLIPHPRRTQFRTWVTCQTVSAVPAGVDRATAYHFDVQIVLFDVDQHQWMVRRPDSGDCLTRDGIWEHEPPDQFKDHRWQAAHLFDLPAAEHLAMMVAPDVLWHGIRAGDLR